MFESIKRYRGNQGVARVVLLAVALWFSLTAPLHAAESLCATVKIEIQQDLTLERQAFDATMRINNGFEDITLEDVTINLVFTDAEGNEVLAVSDTTNTAARFWVKTPTLSNIDTISNGTVNASTVAEMHWLIIPTPGAAGSNEEGAVYSVGANLSYTVRDQSQTVSVDPDNIWVTPMPNLVLDYFLPGEVYGDDAFTPAIIEPPVPFSLGLRIKNIGYGAAQNLKMDTGQPEIIDNELGLLIGFAIESGEVNGVSAGNSLLLNYGNIPPLESAMGRWLMTVTLSGKFTKFAASISHSDDLGGRITSLVDETNVLTHFHVRDVMVDLAGRDSIRDFLVTNDMVVYESEGIDSSVSNMSGIATLSSISGSQYALTVSGVQDGFIYVQEDDPQGSSMVLKSVTRSDGKVILSDNAWLSKTRDGQSWDYYFNLFDVNASGCSYVVVYEFPSDADQSPVLQYIGPKTAYVGTNIGFAVTASDDNSIPQLTAGSLPSGAGFVDNGNGHGIFSWTPSSSQAGTYHVKFKASDGVLEDSETVSITVSGGTPSEFPAWWVQRKVLLTNGATANDFAPAIMGQVRHVADQAWRVMTNLPGGAGFTPIFANTNNYTVVNIGQLKSLATNYYDRLFMSYPWLGAPLTNDFAIANIGQVKNLFDFDPFLDGDSDGMPDWWERHYSETESPTDMEPDDDPDEDGASNLAEYLSNTNPTNFP